MESAISSLIVAAENGDHAAAVELFDTLYAELHRMARRELNRHGAGVTLGTTTLLHETYLDMAGREGVSFPDKARFMNYAGRAMRNLIIDHARDRRACKRGGQFEITSIHAGIAGQDVDHVEISRLGDALAELEKIDPILTEIVDLKFFCGLSFAEIAQMQGVAERTVQRWWNKARIYLRHSMQADLTS